MSGIHLNLAARLSNYVGPPHNTRLHHTRSLVAFVKANPNFTEREFTIYANALQENLKGLRSLQLAPKGVVRYVTNLEQNRAALGHDLFADPKRRVLVEQAVKDRRYVIAGPIKLIQGGTAIIARRPIFLPKPSGSGDTFWGFATVLIDVAPLLAESGLLNLRHDMALSIRGKDGRGAAGDIFYGTEQTAARAFATASVILPTGSWQIAAADIRRYADSSLFNSFWYWIVAWIATSILSAVVYLLVEYPLRLQNAVRTATNDLRAAKETAEAANKAKTEFLATMSHELRTPLTAIRGALGLIDGKVLGDVPAKLSETISIAVNNSDHLSILIDDILDVTKIEAGTMEYKMKPLAVSSLIENAIVVNRPFAERCGTSIRAYPVNADTHYMRYVSSVNRRGGRRCIEEVI
jgi:sensor domain CHASE-containing protein